MATYRAIGSVAEAVARLLEQSWIPNLLNGIEPQFTVYQGKDFNQPMDVGISVFVYQVHVDHVQRTLPPALPHHRRPLPLVMSLHQLQFGWCLRAWEFLYQNTTNAVRRTHDTSDWDWDEFDNTYSNGLQVMSRLDVEPVETDENHWEFNKHLCGDGPIQEYPRNAVYHINPPPWHSDPNKPNKRKAL
jgi:hypothetical protein